MSLRLNPQYEKMLPTMTQEEFEQLKESIRTEGQHYPIIVSENLEVLDGHHRFRACLELDIEPDFEVKHFENKLLEKKFVIEANLRRRHLNNFQLVELAVPLLEIEKALVKQQKPSKNIQNESQQSELTAEDDENSFPEFKFQTKTVEAIAKKAGVSTRTLEKGKKIIEKASEDDKQKLREGKTSINKVYREITPTKTLQKTENIPENTNNNLLNTNNKKALIEILQKLIEQNVFCPECGNKIFQCSQCHKTINELTKNDTPLKQTIKQQPQTNMEHGIHVEEDNSSLETDEDFKDEFL